MALALMNKREATARLRLCGLRLCEKDHGAEHNTASVYGHHGSQRTCIRLYGSDMWVYDPRWEGDQ